MNRYRDYPVQKKIRILILMLSLSFILAIAIFGVFNYEQETRVTVKSDGRNLTESLASTLDRAIYNINENFVFIFGTTDFSSKLYNLYNSELTDMERRTMLQDELDTLQRSNYLIESAFFIGNDRRTAYTLMSESLRGNLDTFLSADRFDSINGVTYLPSHPSPIEWDGEGIAIIYPIRYRTGTEIVLEDDLSASYVVVMMSSNRIMGMLNTGDALHSLVLKYGDSVLAGETEGRRLNYSKTLPLTGLTLCDYIDQSVLTRDLLRLILFPSFLILLLSLVIINISAHILKRYVTVPVGELENAVVEIGRGNYDYVAVVEAEDELGMLAKSITEMGQTISRQIVKIKEDEDEKYKMNIRLLSEQLKPHFIYNTLECIQQEVNTGDKENASQTVRDLSIYLRTALSYGKETISIEDEVKHDLSYVRIMNSRFVRSIILTHRIERGLEDVKIPKTLLQPFIENSIKHGFSLPVEAPTIELMFQRTKSGGIMLSVSDNGSGFNPEEFLQIMTSDYSDDGHVGIRNVYKRLATIYGPGGFSIDVTSAPFFRSTVSITIPF